jgi:hypothetical protein
MRAGAADPLSPSLRRAGRQDQEARTELATEVATEVDAARRAACEAEQLYWGQAITTLLMCRSAAGWSPLA